MLLLPLATPRSPSAAPQASAFELWFAFAGVGVWPSSRVCSAKHSQPLAVDTQALALAVLSPGQYLPVCQHEARVGLVLGDQVGCG